MPSAQRDVKWIFQSSKQLRKHISIDGVKKLCYNRNKKDFEVAYGSVSYTHLTLPTNSRV